MSRFVAVLSVVVAAVATPVVGGGCSITHQVARPATVDELATRATIDSATTDPLGPGGERVAIIHPAIASNVAVADSTLARQLTTESPLQAVSEAGVSVASARGPLLLDLRDVRGYEVRRRNLGTLEGGVAGLLVGAAIGVTIGLSLGNDPAAPPPSICESDAPFGCGFQSVPSPPLSAGEKAVMGAAIAGPIGAAIGAIVGRLIGHTDRFEF